MQRFRRESLAMQKLDHPNIARVLEVGWHGREPYIAFEYFSRGSLDAELEARGPFPERDARATVLQVVSALSAALERGVIHRDVKLRNLFLSEDSTVKLGDFGLALIEGATTLTTHPVLMGTPAYMSPEQALGKPATWRSDQYSLGICFYELLAGQRPFWAETFDVLLFQHVNRPLPDISVAQPAVTAATRDLLRRMTAKKPVDRFESYAALAAALQP
jgi:serine/threonine-protein kinase